MISLVSGDRRDKFSLKMDHCFYSLVTAEIAM